MSKAKKGSWIVTMRCEINKEVICENCTEEQARNDPWEHAVDETEKDQVSYEVRDVQENK